MRPIDADTIPYTMLYKENWIKGTGEEAPGAWKSDIDKMPTIDAVPVVHGYWKETQQPCGWTDIACATCSVCGEDYPLGDYGIDDFKELSHYCCNCGAKMDGGKADEHSD